MANVYTIKTFSFDGGKAGLKEKPKLRGSAEMPIGRTMEGRSSLAVGMDFALGYSGVLHKQNQKVMTLSSTSYLHGSLIQRWQLGMLSVNSSSSSRILDGTEVNAPYIAIIVILLVLMAMSWAYCLVYFMKWFLCDHDTTVDDSTSADQVLDEKIAYDLTADQRRAVLEAIFSEMSKVCKMKLVCIYYSFMLLFLLSHSLNYCFSIAVHRRVRLIHAR